MSRHPQPPPGPLSRRLDLSTIKDGPVRFEMQASAEECAALAADCDLPGIDALTADLRATRADPESFRVTGRVTARIRQTCVVSLDEFASDLSEVVDMRFAPQADVDAMAAARAARPTQEEDEEDLPDPIVGGRIDLGALVAETLALGLDPYPRKPGVVFAELEAEGPQGSPFTVLRSFQGRDPA